MRTTLVYYTGKRTDFNRVVFAPSIHVIQCPAGGYAALKKIILMAVLAICAVVSLLSGLSAVNKAVVLAVCIFGIFYVAKMDTSKQDQK
jgi:thiosulfate reductase cytochrome b subunit